MVLKRLQLALIHVAVAIALVPINSTLNRVMIKELAISATLVSIFASLPYLFSPLQVVIGSYADRHPVFGYRRTPYIILGLLLCVAGVSLAPYAVFLMPDQPALGLLVSLLTFGAWGMGYNVASVSYLSLASELSGEKGRSRTISVMWFMMITGIILTAVTLGRLLETYTHESLQNAFQVVGMVALGLGLLGLIGLEPRNLAVQAAPVEDGSRTGWQVLVRTVLANRAARRFFFYLIILLAAILGQDVLLEPFAGEAFNMSVSATTRITSIWGVCVLVALVVSGLLDRRLEKRAVARAGAWTAMIGFVAIAVSGLNASASIFYSGVVLLGIGTGLSTVSNLSLMLDMTTTEVGLYIGAWGMANSFARLLGTVISGAVRDLVTQLAADNLAGYVFVFILQALLLLISLVMLSRISVQRFREEARMDLRERAALMNEIT